MIYFESYPFVIFDDCAVVKKLLPSINATNNEFKLIVDELIFVIIPLDCRFNLDLRVKNI